MQIKELLYGIEASGEKEWEKMEITGIAYNTRELKKGDVFVCIKGYSSDGHTFVKEAVKKGAVAIIASRDTTVDPVKVPVIRVEDTRKALSRLSDNFFEHPSEDMQIFGVTGTNGKTSITYMIRKVMEEAGKSCGVIGTIAYEYAGIRESAANTTPESYEMQRILAKMKESEVSDCAIEVSSHALFLGRVADIRFDYGIFTNLTPDHLDFHGTLEDYYQAKKVLFYQTKKANLVNVDDSYGKRLFTELKAEGLTCFDYSLKDRHAEFYADITRMDETGSTAAFFIKGEEKGEIVTSIPGVFSVYNMLAAIATCLLSGVSFSEAAAGVKGLSGVPGRFETVENSKGVLAIVDYAHTPDALENVLQTANSFKKGRLICVFGCGGDRDRSKRPLMGKAAGTHADYCVITSDNPRTENPLQIIHDIEEGVYDTGCNYEMIENRYEAIQKAVSIYRKNDIILVAGKGHEDYQVIGTKKIYFDDRQMLKEIIEA